MRKPRSDSVLETLGATDPNEIEMRQARLAEWLMSGEPYHAIIPQLEKVWGIKTSMAALSNYWTKVCGPALIARRRRAVNTANEIADEAARSPGKMDAATLDAIRQKAFELSISPAANPGDVKALFSLLLKARDQDLNERQLSLDREKFVRETCETFLRWYRDERARNIAECNTTNAEKIAALRQTYFADVDALEKAGEVNIPT